MQHYVLGVINGLAIPGQTATLEASIQPPPVDPLDGAKAYVWGGRLRTKRQTTPRNSAIVPITKAGFQQNDWTVDIYLHYETVSDTTNEPNVDQEFPLLVDAVMAALATTTMPTLITDPTTAAVSQMLSIGEDMTLEYPPEVSAGSAQLVYYRAKLSTYLQEVVQR